MNDRSGFIQTTTEITLDLPAACCITSALDKEIAAVEARLARTEKPATIESLKNLQRNLQAAQDAFDPPYRATLAAGLFTPEHDALVEAVLAS